MAARIIVFLFALCLIAFADARIGLRFGYLGNKGPSVWGNLSPEFGACSRGRLQSPIDIVEDEAIWSPLQPLIKNYVPGNATLVDKGFSVAVQWDNRTAGVLNVEGKNYSLVQLHWHAPAEHTINGIRYPAELHLVHKTKDGNVSVVAFLYQFGKPDPFLTQLSGHMSRLAREVVGGNVDIHIPVGMVTTRDLIQQTNKYYRYVGSLTVPPCTERVIWNVVGTVKEMSRQQLLALQEPLEMPYRNNARPVQPLNGRRVFLYQADSLP